MCVTTKPTGIRGKDIKKENEKMWENFKEKCRALSKKRGAVIVAVCLLIAVTVVVSVSVATNRAKKKYLGEDTTGVGAPEQTQNESQTTGEIQAPNYNETQAGQVGADGEDEEEFMLSLPTSSGTIIKGHDATLQVWSDTMGDYRVHLGIDIATAENAPVYAAADGKVSRIWDDAMMGRCVAIAHDGNVFTVYKNLSQTLSSGIEAGAEIKCGQQIGRVGETAIAELADEPHLHLEMTVNGLAVDPVDYFDKATKDALASDDAYEEQATESGK